ncbi:MAG: hypothetical protein N2645_18845 [Clostridia bacterium]|nr:hypothetical protein [Clostridia bacterium]
MLKYLNSHEKFIKKALENEDTDYDWKSLSDFHRTQIAYIQHERLIHLLVTLSFGLFAFISVYFTMILNRVEIVLLDILLLTLLVPYIIHYFKLENGISRWYHLDNEITRRCGKISACYKDMKN